jgi:hypothetical protein
MPVDTAAVGSIVLALALYGAIRVRSRETWFFAGMAVFCLLARAEWKPLARALQKLSLFDQSLNERFSFGAAFALAILAAFGVEELFRHERDRAAVIVLTIALIVLAAGNAWLYRNVQTPAAWGHFKIAAELIGLALAIALIRKPQYLVAVILLQRVVSDGHLARRSIGDLRIRRSDSRAAEERPPTVPHHRPRSRFFPGTSALYELEDVRGYQAMTFRRTFETFPLWSIHQPVVQPVNDPHPAVPLSFSMRYAITWDRDPPPAGLARGGAAEGLDADREHRCVERVRSATVRIDTTRSSRCATNAISPARMDRSAVASRRTRERSGNGRHA